MKVRWGILGTARIANRMALAIQNSNNGKLVAISSRDIVSASEFAKKYNIPNQFGSYEEILNFSEIDAIYNPLPNHLHAPWTINAVNHGKHVLCEKPFALNTDETLEVFNQAHKHGVIVMEGFMYRFNPITDKLVELINQNLIGNLKHINFNFCHPINQYLNNSNNYRFNKEEGGGSLYDLGVYGISLFNYLFDSGPEKILQSLSFQKSENLPDETYQATLIYKDDVICNLNCSFDFYNNFLTISGSNGIIEVSNITTESKKTITVKNNSNEIIAKHKIEEYNHFKAQIEHFSDCIIESKEQMITKTETIDIISVINKLQDKQSTIIKN